MAKSMSLNKDDHLKLLSINNYYYRRGGAEFVFLEQNRLFEEINWEVIPFAMQHPENLESKWSGYFIEEIEFGSHYSLFNKLARVPKVIYSTEARNNLTKLLSKVTPDVCHAHNIYHHISPSILSLLKQHGIPTVITLHDLKLACPAYKMLTHDGICERCNKGSLINVIKHKCIKDSRALSTIVYLEASFNKLLGSYVNNVSKFVVPSKFYLEKFVDWGFNRDQFIHIPNFIDINKYSPDFTAGKKFVYFGRLGHEKGLSTLIQAAAAAKVTLVIVGTGPEEESLKNLANGLDIKVEFLGYQTGEALHAAIRSARAVVLPSEWYENAPISVMEAYALGVPVIGADIGGIPELIREGSTGLSFTSGSVDSLTHALQLMSDKPDTEIESMGRSGYDWVHSEFTADLFRERLLELYASLGVRLSQ